MRTPPPLTPKDIESRVLRICNEYDKIQEAHKNKVNNIGSISIFSSNMKCILFIIKLIFISLLAYFGNTFYE